MMYFPAFLWAHLSQHVFRDVPPLWIPACQQRCAEPGESGTAALHRPLVGEEENIPFQWDEFVLHTQNLLVVECDSPSGDT